MSRKVVGVTPPAARKALPRLLSALEEAYPVRFLQREEGATDGLDALITFGATTSAPEGLDALRYPELPTDAPPTRGSLTFADLDDVDRRLRGRTLAEKHAPERSVAGDGATILALRSARPVWVRRTGPRGSRVDVAACPPVERAEDEPLKELLRAGRFLQLLPLVDFVRTVTAGVGWRPPPLRALLMFDDPNLRWPSYGHIDYAELTHHAERHSYAAAMGMIPIDGVVASRRAARLFSGPSARLSVLVHGLNHEHRELMRPLERPERERLVGQALRRVEAFERRSGVPVSRVLCAPHGEASEPFLETLLSFGMEAQLADLAQPWRPGLPPTGPPLSFWDGVAFVAGGLPLLPRYLMSYPADEVVLRAFLDQPLVLYGHHEDVADGLDPLAAAAELVNGLGDVTWMPAHRLARTNFQSRVDGTCLHVRLLGRKVEVSVDERVTAISVEVPPIVGGGPSRHLAIGAERRVVDLSGSHPTVVTAAARPGRMTVELSPPRMLDHRTASAARPRPWPFVRRAMTETRDRLRPLLR